ncbi:MAG: regulatory protein [Anaerolineaceae bacterium]|nr:MAG: regulatory protein [Anaerolineaceae bacterium]
MRKITAIEPQKKNPRRVNVYLDGDFAFGLARFTAAWLTAGQELGEEKIAALQAEDAREVTYQKALHFLSYRPRSSQEVRQNLLKKGCDEALVEETVGRLQKADLLNDASFAQAWVENRSAFRPRSKSALRMELRRKGLEEDVIGSVLDRDVDEEALAYAAARKQARRYAGLEWPDFRQKLGGFLARRGFSYTILAPVVSEVWKEFQTADAGSTFDKEE